MNVLRQVCLLAAICLIGTASASAQNAQRAQRQQQPAAAAKTMLDVKYGPHARNVLDVWLAKSEKPTPVLVSIHGGGFRQGDKRVQPPDLLDQCLEAGISVAAITYRFSQDAIAPASFTDGARAIQFIRHNAKEWNLDGKRMAATGGSAGAGISLWLGFHDEMADPNNADPVLRESTRLTCMSVINGQTSYDPRVIRDLFPGTDTHLSPPLGGLFGIDLAQLDNLPAEKYKLMESVSPINFVTKDDPPVMLTYRSRLDAEINSQGIGIHHPRFGVMLKKKMDPLGIRCDVYAGGEKVGGGASNSTLEFLKQSFGMAN